MSLAVLPLAISMNAGPQIMFGYEDPLGESRL